MIVFFKCWECKNAYPCAVDERQRCKAYPDGVPLEIMRSPKGMLCSEDFSFEPEEEGGSGNYEQFYFVRKKATDTDE